MRKGLFQRQPERHLGAAGEVSGGLRAVCSSNTWRQIPVCCSVCMLLTSPLPRSSLGLRCKGSVKELCLFAALSEPKMDRKKKRWQSWDLQDLCHYVCGFLWCSSALVSTSLCCSLMW